MRFPRLKLAGRPAVYHCISRIVGGQRLLGDLEKEQLRLLLRRQAAFCGLEVITYCFLDNHFHLLLRVPAQLACTDQELVGRAVGFYGPKSPQAMALQEALAAQGRLPDDLREGLGRRLGDVSAFMKEFKQRFSRWYNRRHKRFGTLWAERFKSLLVEDTPEVVEKVAAYIDLNPVRAGRVRDPKDYRWSGYGEAMGGNRLAQRGLAGMAAGGEWGRMQAGYRAVLLVKSGWAGRSGKVALDGATIRRGLAQGARLGLGQVLRLRVRYLSDGLVLGTRGYVEGLLGEFRDRFGPGRRSGARGLRGLAGFEGLATLRDLRVRAVE
ncbi:MAG: transposase [Verrucomicrobiales bacterium]|nr:transposase [Verrucomicrobiales bacterium]MCP5519838.1 transposase [Verrucomicrobiales bacterium]MCP5527835.1 transposase [Verrucomicrobiales bacterium]MCP5528776.1 transposase [Verrucomicrobiales bacterium]